jgi:hypothetical protein
VRSPTAFLVSSYTPACQPRRSHTLMKCVRVSFETDLPVRVTGTTYEEQYDSEYFPQRAVRRFVRSQVLTATSVMMAVFWDITQCSLCPVDPQGANALTRY